MSATAMSTGRNGSVFLFLVIVVVAVLAIVGSYGTHTRTSLNAHAVERHGEDAVVAWEVIRLRGGEERRCRHPDGTEYIIQYHRVTPRTYALVIKTLDGYTKTALFARAAYVERRPNCSDPRPLEPQAIGPWAGVSVGLARVVAEAEQFREDR